MGMTDNRLAVKVIEKGRPADIGGGLRGPKSFVVAAWLSDHENIMIRVRIEIVSGAYKVTELTLLPSGDDDVSTEFLRLIPLRTIIRGSLAGVLAAENLHDQSEFKNTCDEGPEAILRHAAFTYRLARLLDEAPTVAVMKAQGISRSTATRRVAAAREAGYLQADEIGHAGGARSLSRLEV